MAFEPAYIVARPLGHSWPTVHWWLSLTAGDQGAWISGLGALAAAGVALGIALKDGRRRRAEQRIRARLTMASFFGPVVGIYAMVDGFAKDSAAVAGALAGSAVTRVATQVESLKNGVDIARELVAHCTISEMVHLPGDFGTALAVSIRDVEMLNSLITSCTDMYLPRLESSDPADLKIMHRVAGSLRTVPSQARAAMRRMKPFIDACEKELGYLDPDEVTKSPSP